MKVQIDEFIIIPYKYDKIDRYTVRTSILEALTKSLSFFNGDLLDIGCGKMPYKDYILKNSNVKKYVGLDITGAIEYDKNIKPDFLWDGLIMPFDDQTFECAFGTEVLEHCPEPETTLKEVYRVLRKDGIFFFTVPFLWNLHEIPHDEYRYTPYSLKRHLENSGFTNIQIFATGGWHASLAQMLGLWVRRSPLKRNVRAILSFLLMPLIKYLYNKDKKISFSFSDAPMITGLYGTAKKA